MKRFFDRKLVKVIPKNGQNPYFSYLLSVIYVGEPNMDVVYHISGPEAIFPNDATITEVDGRTLDLSEGKKL